MKTDVNLLGLLGIVFVVLKLCKVITWSWWWVLAPFWIGLPIVGLILLMLLVLRAKNEYE